MKTTVINIKNVIQQLFVPTLILYLMCGFFSATSIFGANDIFNTIVKIIRYISYVIFLFNIIIDYNKTTILDTVLLLLSAVVSFFSKNIYIIAFAIILISLKTKDMKKVLEKVYKVYFFLFVVVVTLALLNIIPNWTFSERGQIRYALGFIYPTDCYSIFLTIILIKIFISKGNVKYYKILILAAINILLYIYTKGRLSFILINFAILMLLISKNTSIRKIIKKILNKRTIKILIITVPALLFVGSTIVGRIYSRDNQFMVQMNEVFNNRIVLASEAYKNYDLKLFGQKIDWKGWGGYRYKTEKEKNYKYNFVDNSYVRLELDQGFIYAALIILLYIVTIVHFYRKNEYYQLLVVMIVLIWSCIEPYIIVVTRNVMCVTLVYSLILENGKSLLYKKIFKE